MARTSLSRMVPLILAIAAADAFVRAWCLFPCESAVVTSELHGSFYNPITIYMLLSLNSPQVRTAGVESHIHIKQCNITQLVNFRTKSSHCKYIHPNNPNTHFPSKTPHTPTQRPQCAPHPTPTCFLLQHRIQTLPQHPLNLHNPPMRRPLHLLILILLQLTNERQHLRQQRQPLLSQALRQRLLGLHSR
jgi:hypothetical protein